MTAPDRIWAVIGFSRGDDVRGEFASKEVMCNRQATEYTRTSLIPAMIADAVAKEREACAALMDLAAKNCRNNYIYPPKNEKQRDYMTGAIVHRNAAAAIRARGDK